MNDAMIQNGMLLYDERDYLCVYDDEDEDGDEEGDEDDD